MASLPPAPAHAAAALEDLRRQGVLAASAGAPFLFVYGWVWVVAGALTYLLPEPWSGWVYLALGGPAVPLALALERRWRLGPPLQPDPFLPLALQLLFVQMLACPAVVLVADARPSLIPVAFAAIVGAHLLPFLWLYGTRVYLVLAIVVAVGPFILAVVAGRLALPLTGFLVGPALLAGSWWARRHARTVAAGAGTS